MGWSFGRTSSFLGKWTLSSGDFHVHDGINRVVCRGPPSYVYLSKKETVLIVSTRLNRKLIDKRNLCRSMNDTIVFLPYFDKYSIWIHIHEHREELCISTLCGAGSTPVHEATRAKVNNEPVLRWVLFFEKWSNDNAAAGLPEAWSTASIFPASPHYALVLSISFHRRFFQPTLSLCFPCLLPTFLYRPVHPSFFSNSLSLFLSFFVSLSLSLLVFSLSFSRKNFWRHPLVTLDLSSWRLSLSLPISRFTSRSRH